MSDTGRSILVIEDEEVIREGLRDNLQLEGYQVTLGCNGIEGLELFEKAKPDMVILDVMMPGLDGVEVCKRIRDVRPDTPIIMLTAKCSEIDKVVGLEVGADDYLTKPFGMRELFARVKALFRRTGVLNAGSGDAQQGEVETELRFASVIMDFKAYRAWKGGDEVELSAKEFDLMRFISSRPDIPVTRNELLDEVWGYNNYPTTRTVDNFIARLRQKLEEVPENPKHIITVHGVGYKFVL